MLARPTGRFVCVVGGPRFKPWVGQIGQTVANGSLPLHRLLISIELPLNRILWAILESHFRHFMKTAQINSLERNSLLLGDAHFLHVMQAVLINMVRCNIFSKEAVLSGRNDAEIGLRNSLHALA